MRAIALFLATTLLVACGDDSKGEPATGSGQASSPPAKPTPPSATTKEGWQADADAAIEKGLAWLKGRAKDGVWMAPDQEGEFHPSAAFTALALAPVARSLPPGERASNPLVKKACAYLLSQQRDDGAIDAYPSKLENYYTSTTLMALSIVDDPAHAEARDRMAEFIQSLQRQEEGRINGGFGYNTAKSADLSNAQFAVEALRAGGIAEDDPAMKQALAFLERCQNRSENAANKDAVWEIDGKEVVPGDDGSAGYEPGVSKAGHKRLPDGTWVARGYGSMTYALLKCYILAGLEKDDPRVQAAVEWLGENYAWDENPGFREFAKETGREDAPYFGLYYYYMTAAKALNLAGVDTLAGHDWRKDLAQELVSRQRDDGSWKNDQSQRWDEALPLLTTSYALIALQEIQAAG